MGISIVAGCLSSFYGEVLEHLHPLFYPFIPYWSIILGALALSPITVLLPQFFQGKLTWPRKEDVPDVWTIHGRRYNLKSFYEQHPGGSFALRSAKGSDCTGLFESCHTFIDREVLLKMVARFEIKDGVEASQPVMVYADPFYDALKQMVRDHFKGKPRSAHKMTWPHLGLCFAALTVYWFLIYHMVVNGNMWCILPIGFLSWYMTGNMMHDGSHNALVVQPWLNRVLSHAAFPYGVNVTGWTIQHVMSHHIYTNLDENDVDLYHFDPLITLKSGVGTVNVFLHYLRLIYIMSSAIPHLCLVVPYGLIFGQVDPAHGHAMYDRVKSIQAHRAELRVELVVEQMAQVAFWLISGYYQGFVKGICGVMSVYVISSYLFSFFTQVSHLQEECHSEDMAKQSFAKRQVATSIDFAADSAFWGHISGGLNTQAIHHCFPSVSAMHLRELYPKFRKVCKEHGVNLKESPSLSEFVMGFVHFAN